MNATTSSPYRYRVQSSLKLPIPSSSHLPIPHASHYNMNDQKPVTATINQVVFGNRGVFPSILDLDIGDDGIPGVQRFSIAIGVYGKPSGELLIGRPLHIQGVSKA